MLAGAPRPSDNARVAGPIRLPPTTGTTGITPAFQPTKPQTVEPVAKAPDGFSANTGQQQTQQTQLTGRDAMRAPGQLTSDLTQVNDPAQLPEKLAGDLKVNLPELVALLNLTRQEKASRLVEFLVPYAAKLAELKAVVEVPAAQQAKLEAKMLEPMKAAGLAQVVETTTGKSGVEIAKQLLQAPTAQEARLMTQAMRFDAPNWAGQAAAGAAGIQGRPVEPQLVHQALIAPTRDQRVDAPPPGEEEQGVREKTRSGVLGKNMLFNVLHLFRADGATLSEREKIEAGIVTIGLISLAIAIAVAVTFAATG